MQAEPKSKIVLHQVLSETILPLFEEIQNQCKQLNELFFQTESMIRLGKTGMVNSSLRTKNWNDLTKNWLNGEGFSRQFEAGTDQFNFEYHWMDFEKTGEPFNVLCLLKVELLEMQYEIEFKGNYKQFKLVRGYNEKLSVEEFTEISTLFVKEAHAQIKEKTKN